MKYSTKLSDAIHLLAFIYINPKNDLSSKTIALSIKTNPSIVRQLMMKLRNGGLLYSTKGLAKPELSREPEQISLLDVYHAIEGDKPLLHLDTNINPECNVGINIQYVLQEYYTQVQNKAEEEMSSITLKDILNNFYSRTNIEKMDWD